MTDSKMLIIFICTGNTCRSPMAEALFKSMLSEDQKQKICVKSRGIAAVSGQPAADNAVAVMREFGCDISNHRAANLSDSEIASADLFICMTGSHAAALKVSGVPEQKIDVLGVPDPFGKDREDYRAAAVKIKNEIEKLYEYITG